MAQSDMPSALLSPDHALPFFRTLVESLETAVVLCDPNGRILLFNRAMARACGTGDAASWESGAADTGELRVGAELSRIRSCLRNLDGSRVVRGQLPLGRALRGEHIRSLELQHRRNITSALCKHCIKQRNSVTFLSQY